MKKPRMTETPRVVVPIAQVSREIGKSEGTIRRWIKAGAFPGHCVGQSYLIPVAAYESWKRGEWVPRTDKEIAA